ncbi:hypothetical protein PAXINDRAFT_100327 [Paxillus involutus ATCC 200175]|uniref:DUF6532 domain-containing protein n=1 Tax=Paxillus involutus ATCC 200175 TaxID=664439 RepID=A0A0C9SWY0_PAXIN|nr:hypothetical protein PAXINDRAFT_100327 [Paxillus involutus ATCC 200175]
MAVAALFEAAREDKESDIMRRLRCDSEYSNYLASVPEARLASHRLGFKKVAQPIVIASYGLKKGCSELVTELLINDNFIYPQTAKGDAIRNLPFSHPAVVDLIRALIFNGPSALGSQYRHEFVSILEDADDAELPSGLVSLMATTIYSVLVDWRSGTGPADPKKVSFHPDENIGAYCRYERLLKRIFSGERGPQKYHTLMARLYCETGDSVSKLSTETTDSATFDYLDFDGMPEN